MIIELKGRLRSPSCADARRQGPAQVLPLPLYVELICPRCKRVRYWPLGELASSPRHCNKC